jgi:glycerate-2-kinase
VDRTSSIENRGSGGWVGIQNSIFKTQNWCGGRVEIQNLKSEIQNSATLPPMVSLERMREDALAAFDAAVAAVQPENLIQAQVTFNEGVIRVDGEPLPDVSGRRVVFSVGKAAAGLVDAWMKAAPSWATELYVLTPHDVPVPETVESAATVLRGAHPYPDADGEESTEQLLETAKTLGDEDALIVLVSGGGSALMAAAERGLTLSDVRATTEALLKAGAPITEVNTVRRQLLAAAGGGLGRAAHPAQIRTLILSDVLGDPLPDIASGPTVSSTSTQADALAVLDRFSIRGSVPGAVVRYLEAAWEPPQDDGAWAKVCTTRVIGNNRTAVEAAATELRKRGYEVEIAPGDLVGEASVRGRELAMTARITEHPTATAVVFGGETTVTVRGPGRGGRNQELALAAAMELEGAGNAVVLAGGTDGIDGLSENAGAVVDTTTTDRLRQLGIDPSEILANNDSGTALETIGDAIRTGPTGTNVCDVTLVLTAPTTE